jgi:hypothetical protein
VPDALSGRSTTKSAVLNDWPFSHVPRNGGVPVKRACSAAAAQSLRNTYSVAVGLSQAWLTTTCLGDRAAELEAEVAVVAAEVEHALAAPVGMTELLIEAGEAAEVAWRGESGAPLGRSAPAVDLVHDYMTFAFT